MSNLKKYTYTRYYPVGDNIEHIDNKSCLSFDYNSDGSVRIKVPVFHPESGAPYDGAAQAGGVQAFHPFPAEFFRPADSYYSVLNCVSSSEYEAMAQRVLDAVSAASDAAPDDYRVVIAPSTRQGVFCKSSNINYLYSCFFRVVGAGGILNRQISIEFGLFGAEWSNGWPSGLNPARAVFTYITPQSGGTAQWQTILANATMFISKIRSYFTFYISPRYTFSSYEQATNTMRITAQNTSEPQLCAVMKEGLFSEGQYDSGDIIVFLFTMSSGYSTISLTDAGEVDPTDPGETPDPPVPPGPVDPPDPPNIPDPDDPIPPPTLPTLGGCGLGFFTVYNPSDVAMRLLANKFWTPSVFDAIKQDFQNPMETIIGFGIVPVQPTTGSSKHVMFGKYDSEVSALEVTSDYKIIDCGSRVLHTYYGSYLDFEPYTKVSMYLPYCGEVDMNPDEMIGKTIGVLYYINVITGDIVAMVTADGTVIYTAASNCFRQLPLSQADYSQIIQSAISAVMALGAVVAGGAAGAAGASAMGAQGSLPGLVEYSATSGEVAQGAVQGMMNSSSPSMLNNVMSTKVHYKRASQLGTGSGQLSIQYPYMTVLRPNLMLPDGAGDVGTNSDLKAYKGYPCNQIAPLSSCHGLTIVEDMRLSIPGATVDEIEETLSLLKGGAIL